MVVEVSRDVHTIVRVTGEIDMSNVSRLENALDRACEESPCGFVVDASAVSYMDGTGIRAILAAWVRTRDRGGALMVVPSEILGEVLDAVGAVRLPRLLLCDSVEGATDALSGYTGGTGCFQD